MLMLAHPESPDYCSSVSGRSELSSRIISSPLEKMPLELLRSTHPTGQLDEALSPTDCSEDSVEIRSPRPASSAVLRPSAVLAAPPPSSLKRTYKNWLDFSKEEEPEEKRVRRATKIHPTGPSPAQLPLYGPSGGLLKFDREYPHPADALVDRNRLLHQWMTNAARFDDVPSWMRTGNWPLAPPMEAAQLMTSALHYYPHLVSPSSYLFQPPPPPPAAMMMPHPFLHPQHPSVYLSYGLPLFHRPPAETLRPEAIATTLDVKKHPSAPSPIVSSRVPDRLPRATTPPAGLSSAIKSSKSPDKVVTDDRKAMIRTTGGLKKSKKLATVAINLPASGSSSLMPKEKANNPNRPNSSGAAFLSVETLLSRPSKPSTEVIHPEEEPEAFWALPKAAFREPPHLPGHQQQQQQSGSNPSDSGAVLATNRNYKNMTRERRMQANARERTRVHTISAAFEALRRAVPSFSHGQRLSKLSILRVASAYIAALGQLAGDDDATGADSLVECVDRCTRTLMTEGQMLRRKRSGVPRPAGEASNNPSDEDDDDD